MFYCLFGWEMKHLHTGGSCPVVSGQGGVIMTSFGPPLGGLPNAAEAVFNFSFCYVTLSKNQLFCRYIIIKLVI